MARASSSEFAAYQRTTSLASKSPGDSWAFQTRSECFRQALARIERFARDRTAPILLEGEAGTGKTTVARYIHQRSPRSAGPYHSVILSTLDDSLASSELFGHVAGAFTDARYNRAGHFVSANGGTLFLDEIGKASRAVQQKLLHAVEYGEIRAVGSDRDVRIDLRLVFATNVSLHTLVDNDAFLPDLAARIGNFRVVLPPLRERRADIPFLVEVYTKKHAERYGYMVGTPEIHPDLLTALQAAEWPGNMRQLDAAIHRLVIDAEGATAITLDHCVDDLLFLRDGSQRVALTAQRVDGAISRAGSITGAARLLGVDRTTVHRFQRRRGQDTRDDMQSVAPHFADNEITVVPQCDEKLAKA